MLRFLNKLLHDKHIQKNGCVGIYCDGYTTSSIQLFRQKNTFSIVQGAVLSASDLSGYRQNLLSLLDANTKQSAPVFVSLSSKQSSYDVMHIASLPDSKKSRDAFIRWRYEKQYKQKTSNCRIAFSKLGEELNNKFVGVALGNALLDATIETVVNSAAVIQSVAPAVTVYPSFLSAFTKTDVRYSIFLRLTHSGWMLAFIGQDDILFCRHNAWLDSKTFSFELLKGDIQNIAAYFAAALQLDDTFPIYILDGISEPHTDELIRACITRKIYRYRSGDFLASLDTNINPEHFSIDAVATAVAGMVQYD